MSPDAVICPSITKMYRIARIYAKLWATFVDLCARSLTNLCEWFVGPRWSFLWRIQLSAFPIGWDVDNHGEMWWNLVEFIEICSDSAELSHDAAISPSFTLESSAKLWATFADWSVRSWPELNCREKMIILWQICSNRARRRSIIVAERVGRWICWKRTKFIEICADSVIEKCLPMPWWVRRLQKCRILLEFMQNCPRHSSICARDRWQDWIVGWKWSFFSANL